MRNEWLLPLIGARFVGYQRSGRHWLLKARHARGVQPDFRDGHSAERGQQQQHEAP